MKKKFSQFLWHAVFNMVTGLYSFLLLSLVFTNVQAGIIAFLIYISLIKVSINEENADEKVKQLEEKLEQTRHDYVWLKERLENHEKIK